MHGTLPQSRKFRKKRQRRVTQKQGRPSQGERDPVSHRRPDDQGTPELLLRKVLMVGPENDLSKAEYPLGVMLARGWITLEQHNAGMDYARLHAFFYGKGRIGATSLETVLGGSGFAPPPEGEPDEEAKKREKRAKDRYERMRRRLKSCGRRSLDAVEHVAVYWTSAGWPEWFDTKLGRRRVADLLAHRRASDSIARIAVALQEMADS